MHPYPLKKFRTKDENEQEALKKEAEKEKKKETYKDDDGNEYEYDDEIPECYWLCNGAEENTGLVDGCKSNQKDFAFHAGIEGWQSTQEGEDFDLCEMCIRWAMHCDRFGIELELVGKTSEQ